jgi:hypothetical protein
MHHLEAHRFYLGQAPQGLGCTHDISEALADRRRIIRALATRLSDALYPAFGKHRLRRHVEHPVLEGGAPDIGYQTFH